MSSSVQANIRYCDSTRHSHLVLCLSSLNFPHIYIYICCVSFMLPCFFLTKNSSEHWEPFFLSSKIEIFHFVDKFKFSYHKLYIKILSFYTYYLYLYLDGRWSYADKLSAVSMAKYKFLYTYDAYNIHSRRINRYIYEIFGLHVKS